MQCLTPHTSFFKTYVDNTFIFNVICCAVALRNFTTDGVLRGIFVSKKEEEGVNWVVKSFITCEIHEGLYNVGRLDGGVMQHARGNEK